LTKYNQSKLRLRLHDENSFKGRNAPTSLH